jgi:hypothetical protein
MGLRCDVLTTAGEAKPHSTAGDSGENPPSLRKTAVDQPENVSYL